MKRILLCVCSILLLTGNTTGVEKEVGVIGNIDTTKKEIIVNNRSGTNLNMGDLLEIQSEKGKIIIEVSFPMMTTSRCKIKNKGKLSELSKGMTVYRYSKDDEPAEETGKAGNIKKIGNIEMIMLEGGTFQMGSDMSDDEKPVHSVTIDQFWIGKYEVTQKQYEEIMGTNPSKFKEDNLPVEQVSWNDAIEFCKKFSKKYKVKARLPYEAEWEYACKAGTSTKYYWGNEMNGDYCWYDKNSDSKTHPVGQKKPNAFGLYDMSGNVSEWCADLYDADYYKESPSKNPTGAQNGNLRVLRGESWYDISLGLRSSGRFRWLPEVRFYNYGFRVVVAR